MRKEELRTPYFIAYRDKLEKNLRVIDRVSREAGVKIIMALKANAYWPMFEQIKTHGYGAAASSPNELFLAREYLSEDIHSFSPAYTEWNIDLFLRGSSHITFNSVAQYKLFANKIRKYNEEHPGRHVSAGIRINPEVSVVKTDKYNAALPGSRFGVCRETLAEGLPEGVEGLHFHALCESGPEDLAKVLKGVEEKFGKALSEAKWLNMGGGHLMTSEEYDEDRLVKLLQEFKHRHPGLEIILEPGSAFTWQTGDLEVSVVDVVEHRGVSTAIIDASFACHMPDTLEMPYQPTIAQSSDKGIAYRLGGNSCLSGDYCGPWYFEKELKAGDRLTLKDMNHYTTVKTNMFNGLDHPMMVISDSEESPEAEVEKVFGYTDYKNRMG